MSETKEIVLRYLEKNKGSYFSGEAIAKELSLSRNSVWKAIESLRRDGYHIEAASRRGYSLSSDADIISASSIKSFLSPNITIENIEIHDKLESTNKTAKGAASFGARHGTVIIAREQTAGSGRKNHSFYSPDGGIYMSIVIIPDHIPLSDPALIIPHTANCICKSIEKLTDLSPSIKWTNDIYLGSKKICGILTESGMDFESGELQWIVLGIGINFSMNNSDFPNDIKNKAGALFTPGEETISRNHLIAEILNRILASDKYDDKMSSEIISEYKSRMNMLGKQINVIPKNSDAYVATAIDINKKGKLIVELPDCSKQILSSEEISITWP